MDDLPELKPCNCIWSILVCFMVLFIAQLNILFAYLQVKMPIVSNATPVTYPGICS